MPEDGITNLAAFMRGYSCAIGPIRSADPNEMSNAVTAATIVLHAPFVDAVDMWALIATDAVDFLVENAVHMKEHHAEELQCPYCPADCPECAGNRADCECYRHQPDANDPYDPVNHNA